MFDADQTKEFSFRNSSLRIFPLSVVHEDCYRVARDDI